MAVSVMFSACTKEGPAGKDGNANVVSSSMTALNWSYNAPNWTVSFNIASITQDIVDRGAVLAYVKVGNNFSQLPLTFYQDPAYSTSVGVLTVLGGVLVTWTDSDLTQPINPGPQVFKFVVISASSRQQHPNIDYTNYEEVKNAFNLED